MLKIRLSQVGKSGQRSYRIRVMDSHQKRDTGRYLDDLGYWNRIRKEFKLDREKYETWLSKGAQPTDSVDLMYKRGSASYKLWFAREKVVNWIGNLPENKIEISLPKSNFRPSKIKDLSWEVSNFTALDLKNKLKENDYQLIKSQLPKSWTEEEELVKQIFKGLRIEAILSRRDNHGKVSIVEDDNELPLLLRPFNFEFSIAILGKVYSTKSNPIRIIEPEPSKE